MKRKLFLAFMSISIFACSDDIVNEIEDDVVKNIKDTSLDIGTYPLSEEARLQTKSDSWMFNFNNDWENQEIAILATGKKTYTPWAKVSDSNVPLYAVKDIKKKDGWQLIYHSLGERLETASDGINYVVLHNIRTGIIKVFCYVEKCTVNTTAWWQLTFENDNKYLNFTEEIAHPLSLDSDIRTYTISTLSVNRQTKPFNVGWNCFTFPVAYSPNINGYLRINPGVKQVSLVNLVSSYNSYSEGVILTETTRNNPKKASKALVNLAGDAAEKWVKDQFNQGNVKDTQTKGIGNIIGNGAKELVKSGLNNIFGSLLGSYSKQTNERQELQFSTYGTDTIIGRVEMETNAGFKGLLASTDEFKVGVLGVWNLQEPPIIYVNKYAEISPRNGYTPDMGYCSYRCNGISKVDLKPIINPQLKNSPYYKSHSVSYEVVRYNDSYAPSFEYKNFNYGKAGGADWQMYNTYITDVLLYENKTKPLIHKFKFDGDLDTYTDSNAEEFEYSIDITNPYNLYLNGSNICFDKYNFVRVTFTLITEIDGQLETTVSTKTFVPRIEWI